MAISVMGMKDVNIMQLQKQELNGGLTKEG